MSATSEPEGSSRPRVEGAREQEILEATLDVLVESGFDRLTMDAVATRAKASKATLYRRWNGKTDLVIDALVGMKGPQELPDTGTLRGDLMAAFCGLGSMTDTRQTALLASVVTAIGRDPEFAAAYRERFIAPKTQLNETLYRRAMDRGEIRSDLDLSLIAPALPGIILHRLFLIGDEPTEELIATVIDQIILPAVQHG